MQWFWVYFMGSQVAQVVKNPPATATTTTKLLQSCPTLCDSIDGSPLDSPVPGFSRQEHWSCHFLLQCMKVKRESEVAQLCPILSDPMDCSPPGSPVPGIFQARVLEWGAIAFSGRPILVEAKKRVYKHCCFCSVAILQYFLVH